MRRFLPLAAVSLFVLFICLGNWQVQRYFWKQDLIARVDARVHAAPTAAPGPTAWPALVPQQFEYQPVQVKGQFDFDHQLQVQASSTLGAGFWVLTPLKTEAGWWLWVNRGFVPPAREMGTPMTQPSGLVTVQGLMRVTEPKGGFLRHNDAQAQRWFSRDVAAMTAARGLPGDAVAPYFIDAAANASAKPGEWPVGGLTVIRFANNHLAYIFTWYTLALMVLGASFYVWRQDRRGPAPDDFDDAR
ncbi:hypothetical protein CCO03_10785 [Comamonas serinivorans]|uniref:SURF1-like protein n=1 Tax=Comamonas serinivorans TaxID=1082851 RepID=A0A1Y0ENX6_9BURK|nr:SURF1 family protein [Comamonas serinivorans]ARU05111.1 hypothetical protein CCO03_10785 [Comamonas serinivorans]